MPNRSRHGVRKLAKWECLWCGRIYDRKSEAEKCAALGFPTAKFKVGDIVKFYPRFGWNDGDDDWIEAVDHTKPMLGKGKMSFYYVIVAIEKDEREPHRAAYFVITDAMTAEAGYRGGRTYEKHHVTPRRLNQRKVPKKVRDRAREIVESGERVDYLL